MSGDTQKMKPLVHKHLIVRAEVTNPPKDETLAKEFLKELIEGINMKILFGPEARYVDIPGNRGLTCFAIIETSHIVMHTWDECNPAMIQLDVYTCGALDTDVVFDFLRRFGVIKMDYKFLDRENDLKEIPLTGAVVPMRKRRARKVLQVVS
jgi:S-adenosylmethionine/arginine decarboxylase-like enzyme